MKTIYIIGSLKNPEILSVHKELEALGLEPFSDWKCPGPDADDYLRDYYRERGLSYSEILESYGVRHVFEFDRHHLSRCDAALMVMPAGKSGHLELGYCVGLGKPAFILMDGEPERVDVMHAFATKVFMNREEMNEYFKPSMRPIPTESTGATGLGHPGVSGCVQGSGRKVLREFSTYSEAAEFAQGGQIVFNEEYGTYYVLDPTTRRWITNAKDHLR